MNSCFKLLNKRTKLNFSLLIYILLIIGNFSSCVHKSPNSPQAFVPFTISLQIDSICSPDTINAYFEKEAVVFFHLPTWLPKGGFGIPFLIDTTTDTTFFYFQIQVTTDTSGVYNITPLDSFAFSDLENLRNRCDKYISFGAPGEIPYKTVFLSGKFEHPLPILNDKSIPNIINQKNRICILDVYQRFCPPCTRSTPTYLHFDSIYRDSGVSFYAVQSESSHTFDSLYRVTFVPSWFVFKNSILQTMFRGENGIDSLDKYLSELIHTP